MERGWRWRSPEVIFDVLIFTVIDYKAIEERESDSDCDVEEARRGGEGKYRPGGRGAERVGDLSVDGQT